MIVKDEFDYLIEWLAYHRVAGFEEFYIADNGSTDGTRELLESLQMADLIKLIYQPILPTHSQVVAYNRIVEIASEKLDVIMFIDADEFLVHDSFIDGEEIRELRRLFCDDPSVAMIGVNWRCFGSSGHEKPDGRLVIERFTWCSDDKGKLIPPLPGNQYGIVENNISNNYIKSAYRMMHLVWLPNSVDVHHAVCLPSNTKKINCLSEILLNDLEPDREDFSKSIFHGNSAVTRSVCPGPLRINHYAVKSKEEFMKKRKRGNAIWGPSHDIGESYFKGLDLNDIEFRFPEQKIRSVKETMRWIEEKLADTVWNDKLCGFIDGMYAHAVHGWLSREDGTSEGLYVSVFINGVHQGVAPCRFYREDVKAAGFSADGLCGFRFTFSKPLEHGDKVDVFVYGNRFRFEKQTQVF